MGKADALRKSKLDYVLSGQAFAKQPYFWAGLVLFGDNEAMKLNTFTLPVKWIVSGMILLIVLIYFFNRHSKRKQVDLAAN